MSTFEPIDPLAGVAPEKAFAAGVCRCMTPPFNFRTFSTVSVGVDETDGRFGEVFIDVCTACGKTWLRYHLEYEAFSKSGRWYRGLLPAEAARTIQPETAVAVLQRLDWYFAGGSYFSSAGFRSTGPLALAP